MIPQQTFENYPVFGDNATKVAPDNAKYSAGFQQADVLPAEWMNWAWNKNTKGITALNTGLDSVEKEIINVLDAASVTPAQATNNQLLTSINYLITQAEIRAKLAAHPIGSLYWSSDSTDPGTLFGGTWTRIKDAFVWAAGDSDTVNTTGGSKTITLETQNLPSHTHEVGAHSHGLNSHTHTLNNGNTSSSGTTTTAGIRHSGNTGAMSGNSTGSFLNRVIGNGCAAVGAVNGGGTGSATATGNCSASYKTGYSNGGGSAYPYASYETERTQISINVSHTHSLPSSYIYGKTDAASGSTANSTAFDTGSTGNGTAVNVMNPYIVKYCFERIS